MLFALLSYSSPPSAKIKCMYTAIEAHIINCLMLWLVVYICISPIRLWAPWGQDPTLLIFIPTFPWLSAGHTAQYLAQRWHLTHVSSHIFFIIQKTRTPLNVQLQSCACLEPFWFRWAKSYNPWLGECVRENRWLWGLRGELIFHVGEAGTAPMGYSEIALWPEISSLLTS